MKRTDMKSKLSIIVLLSWLLFMLLLFACSSNEASEEQAADSASSNSSDEIAQVEEVEPTVAPTNTPVFTETIPVDNCLDCHTNKDMLIDTADPEEEVISENEGEG